MVISLTTSREIELIGDLIAREAVLRGWDKKFDAVTIIPIESICYVGECVVCHEDTMLADEDSTGICDSCKPHVCIPELPEDDWCDLCGRTFPTPI